MRLPSAVGVLWALLQSVGAHEAKSKTCRNVPGSAGYPTAAVWSALNATIGGRLVNVVPSAKYCDSLPGGSCTDAQWTSGLFRSTIPGAMTQVNWEQGYDLSPPSLCLRNATACGQGDVPIYSVEAQNVADIQAAVKFASAHNLRLAVKGSGHDWLGRSTAPNSLLIRTGNLQSFSVTEAFFVGTQNMGSAATVGSGLHMQILYQQTKANGKIVVGGNAATVCAAGGYMQGGGHSATSPLLGLAVDNVLEYHIVVASGELLQVNSISHPDLFYALRGGGAGSWGVIVSATFRTFPTFEVAYSLISLSASSSAAAGALATVHAQHIFDFDAVRASQYSYVFMSSNTASLFQLNVYMPNTTTAQAKALLAPFLNASLALPGVSLVDQQYVTQNINDAMYLADDSEGNNIAMGSRLIPASTYRDAPETVGKVYKELLDAGTPEIVNVIVGGGQVAVNANISAAIHPAWRTAKSLLTLGNFWTDDTPLAEINALRRKFQTTQLSIVEQISGPNGATYSNEADVFEPDFQTTFFGPNYARLSAIKIKYDPADLFIVQTGVGSERWDQWGLCNV
ncbi:FAD-binding domain-containing protein [Mycena capillaripes]|nr:FAD-binding domain-containing protein [Mycena capillaripes]